MAYLHIQNKGKHEACFEARVIRWEGINDVTPKLDFFYNLGWEQFDLNNPNSIDCKLKAEGRNRLIIAKDEGLNAVDQDKIQYRNIVIPSNQIKGRSGLVPTGSELQVTIEILSEPSPRKAFTRFYFLSVDKNGKWIRFEEVRQ